MECMGVLLAEGGAVNNGIGAMDGWTLADTRGSVGEGLRLGLRLGRKGYKGGVGL